MVSRVIERRRGLTRAAYRSHRQIERGWRSRRFVEIPVDRAGRVPFAGERNPLTKGPAAMDLMSTLPGSMMEGFLPAGWDLAKIDGLAAAPAETIANREKWWH